MKPGAEFFAEIVGGEDPARVSEAADRAANLLVRGARDADDPDVAERVLHLAETEGIETIAEVWSGSPADSLAGCLWRLFVLRSWVYADPVGGRAGVRRGPADRPGRAGRGRGRRPARPGRAADDGRRGAARDRGQRLRGRAVPGGGVRAGRGHRAGPRWTTRTEDEVARMLVLAEQLEAAGHEELAHGLA